LCILFILSFSHIILWLSWKRTLTLVVNVENLRKSVQNSRLWKWTWLHFTYIAELSITITCHYQWLSTLSSHFRYSAELLPFTQYHVWWNLTNVTTFISIIYCFAPIFLGFRHWLPELKSSFNLVIILCVRRTTP
jgi:hypothetical protein